MLSFNMPRIKFTFDVDNVINSINKNNNHNFQSNGHYCNVNYNRLITQKEVYEKLPNIQSNGYCVLTSIYNAFSDIFKNVDELASFIIKIIKQNKPYSSMQVMTKMINNYKNANLLFCHDTLDNSYNIVCNNIMQDKPVAISYKFNDINPLIRHFSMHAVTIFGFDDKFIYYKENSEDNYLCASLILYIRDSYYYRQNEIDNLLIMQLVNASTIEEAFDIGYKIIGFNKVGNGLCAIKKEFLTNSQYFYDYNNMITHNNEIVNHSYYDDYCDDEYHDITLNAWNTKLNL